MTVPERVPEETTKERIEPFLGHRGGCAAYKPQAEQGSCDCGLTEAREMLAEAARETMYEPVGHRERREQDERIAAAQRLRESGHSELADAVMRGEVAVPEVRSSEEGA